MTAPATPAPKSRGLDLLVVIAAVLAAGSAAAGFFVGKGGSAPAVTTVPVEELNGIALDAQGAAGGDEAALVSLQKELELLRKAMHEHEEAAWATDPKFS